jgi:glyoxylase-like metal-dependent hydrolase (beta-lactamase superfamily II)
MGQCEVMGPEVYDESLERLGPTLLLDGHCGNGKTAIITTGPPADLTGANTAGCGSVNAATRGRSERPLKALASIGIKPEDVDYVLITGFRSAPRPTSNCSQWQVCISQRGWIEDFHADKFPMHVPREFRLSDETLRYLMFEGHKRLRLLADEDEIMPGLHCFWAGVHHRSSMCYVVQTAQGRVGISDCLFKYGNLEDGEPLGIQESLEEYYLTTKRIKRETDIFIPLYEPDVVKRFDGGS